MEFINWGSETQEQLLIRRKLEEAAQLEAYAKWVNRIRATSGAVGSGGGSDDTENQYVENGYISNYFV